MSRVVQYAIVDGAIVTDLLDFLAELDPPHCCLYAEPLAQSMLSLAPYLIEATPDVLSWLESNTTPWGIFLYTSAMMKDVRHHLRKYLQILLPSEEKPVFFRFYDPRNIWDVCLVLTDWELHCFLGPIEKIASINQGMWREESFLDQRAPFPKVAQGKFKLFKISQSQLDMLNQLAQEKYIDGLVLQTLQTYSEKITYGIQNSEPSSPLHDRPSSGEQSPLPVTVADVVRKISSDCFHFCQENGIEDDRSIRGMLHLLIEKDVFWIEKLPLPILGALSNTTLPGYYRVERLLKQELGYIPR
ncbi:DUF4123 domain-containing protein [Pectobacterium polaris]|uniref:DUF4123 domain-containing protein n=1 Tax=Pectobacterium polaris TaxID=2042057 RepID=UPI0021C7228B|nr:DUF4123 domain-containing protein [Pectobacterium polaris]MCU1793815.1 hypothetical protein [Pectobacterium polaris]